MQRPQAVLVFGAGGYARCVIDAIVTAGGVVEAVVDHAPAGDDFMGRPVWQEARVLAGQGPAIGCVAIGDNARREDVVTRIRAARPNFVFPTIIHPRAIVSSSAEIGAGAVILAGAVINPNARVGAQSSIYSNAVVEHDCVLEPYVTLAPAATLGGDVKLGARVFVGLGAVVSHGVAIGADSVVGAGAAVLQDQAAGQVIVGAPARAVRARTRGEGYL
jgi:sugar O-acyltransferase (sialic acid O-acetyltransferase NeuD family)